MKLIRITTSYFCLGIEVEDDKIVKAPPILRWAMGKNPQEVKDYFTRKETLEKWEVFDERK